MDLWKDSCECWWKGGCVGGKMGVSGGGLVDGKVGVSLAGGLVCVSADGRVGLCGKVGVSGDGKIAVCMCECRMKSEHVVGKGGDM